MLQTSVLLIGDAERCILVQPEIAMSGSFSRAPQLSRSRLRLARALLDDLTGDRELDVQIVLAAFDVVAAHAAAWGADLTAERIGATES